MRVEIRNQGVELTEAARERLGRRLEFALGRLESQVSQVWIHLADTNGPRGGVDKRCRVLVRLPGRPGVLVEGQDADLGRLLDRTLNRAGLATRRELGRAAHR